MNLKVLSEIMSYLISKGVSLTDIMNCYCDITEQNGKTESQQKVKAPVRRPGRRREGRHTGQPAPELQGHDGAGAEGWIRIRAAGEGEAAAGGRRLRGHRRHAAGG